MYLGRNQLGTWLDVYLPCVNADRTPLMPDAVPTIKIRRASDGVVVYTDIMGVVEKSGSPIGLFCSRLLLSSGFAVGLHDVTMVYVAGGVTFTELRTFEIMQGGHQRGQVLSMIFAHFPQHDDVVYQCESGVILKGKSPKLSS